MRHILYPFNRATLSLLVLVLTSALTIQSQAQSGSVTTTQSFSYTGQIVTWTVPTGVTSLTIEARGAKGAAGGTYAPGKGAIIKGTLTVTPGQQLSILVGQQPVSIQGASTTGGGGGSFVVRGSNPVQPLVIAGGGGGSGGGDNSANLDSDAKNGQVGNNGGAATARSGADTGGTAGNGGGAGSGQFGAGGGGGLLSDGTSSGIRPGGKAFVNGGAGGLQDQPGDNGGFGGGGSGLVLFDGNNAYLAGGGGGGYSGGGGSSINNSAGVGSGGGSFNGGTNQTNTAGANSGNGLVIITYAVPTQPIRYVKQGGTGDGTSWAKASGDLQSQIDIAGAEQVWVATGIYKPGPANNTNRSISFVMKNGVAMYGGFLPDNSGTLANRNPASFTTVLSGDIDGDGTLAGNSYHVVSISNASAATRLDGFVITSGNAGGGGESNNGGGIYNIGSGGNRSNPTLVNLMFIQHTARFGAGMFNRNGSPSLTNVSFSQNTAVVEGGGIYNDAGSPLLTNCLFSQNRADNGGAMLNYQSSNPLLTNCSFSQNTATTQGGALRNNVNSHPSLTNCILWENGGQNAIVNLTSTNGGTTANYCLIEPAETDYTGQNNRALDPLFTDAAAGNLQLQPCSPAIDAGDNSVNTTPTDLAGNNRRQRTIDLGAYEFQGTPNSPVAITQQPASGSSVCAGSTVTAMVSATGTSPAYQWYKGSALVSGQTSPTLTLTNVQPSDAGSYSVVVTGSCNSVISTAFSLTVNALPSVSITPTNQTICQGQSATLTAQGASTYKWSTGATTAAISVSAMGPYSVTGTNTTTGCSNTATANVTVTPLPNATFTGLSTSVCVDAAPLSLSPVTTGGTFSGPGINGNTFSPASAGAGGPYSITYTVSNMGCPNASVQMVTVNPLPQAPMIATQSGHSYSGGVSSLTISQNTGNVVLMASGCMGGTITWAGGSSNTLAVSTMNTGVQTFTATCTSNSTGCTSPKATATVTVVGTTLSVLHRDATNGQINTNTLNPYLELQNNGNMAIPYQEITVRYFLTVENPSPLQFQINYAQLGSDKVHLKYVPASTGNPTATGYIEFSFDASAGSLGAGQNSGPIQDIINKQDFSNFDQSNDYSYVNVGQYTPNPHITAYRNGTIFYGMEPGPVTPVQSVKAMLQNNTGADANSIEAVLSVTNDGNVPINYGDLKVRYYFTADNNQALVLSQGGYTALGSGNVSAQIVTISPPLTNADRYLELSFSPGLGQLAPGASTGGVTYQIRHADYSGFNQNNDYSYQGTGGIMVNPHVVVFVAGTRAYGTEPGAAARLGVEETGKLSVQVLGNPVTGAGILVSVRGAEGQPLRYELTDVSGYIVGERQVESAGVVDEQSLSVSRQPAGLLLLRVSTPTRSQTVKVLRQ